jgi:tetratricopeptide (TPR) repeat protein
MPESIDNLFAAAARARLEQRYGEARRDLEQAVAAGRRSHDKPQLARALGALGQIERDLHNDDDALHLYEEAVEIYRALHDPLKLAHTVRHVGDILRRMGRVAAAGSSYAEALSVYRAHPEARPLELANALRGFALLKEAVGEKVEARAMWEEAGSLYAEANVESGVAESARKMVALGEVRAVFRQR